MKHSCPNCKSDNLWEKTPGWFGDEEDNPAMAGCCDCKWLGTIGETVKAARLISPDSPASEDQKG